jgi:hypothetical protein
MTMESSLAWAPQVFIAGVAFGVLVGELIIFRTRR